MGVYWCDGDGRNISCPLSGHVQTNQRAELHAVLSAIEAEFGPREIRSDSKYVVDGCLRNRRQWRSEVVSMRPRLERSSTSEYSSISRAVRGADMSPRHSRLPQALEPAEQHGRAARGSGLETERRKF